MAKSKHQVNTEGLLIPTLLQGEIEEWQNTGWAGVTRITAETLTYWFEEDREEPQFHQCQQQAIETIIYCHEILEIENPYQLYQKFDSESPTFTLWKNRYC